MAKKTRKRKGGVRGGPSRDSLAKAGTGSINVGAFTSAGRVATSRAGAPLRAHRS
jgi:hypothetical protein